MKLLLFSDLHVNGKLASEIVRQSAEVDLVIGAGDFATIHRGLSEMMEILKTIQKPSFLVPGNSETFSELKKSAGIWREATVLHGTGAMHNGHFVYGIGGGIPVTPFGSWSFDFTEEEAYNLLEDCPEKAILISHSPPYGILDKSTMKKNLGSVAIREAIEKRKPKLVVCGHIHESSGKTELVDQTLVVNAGPKGMIVEID